MSRISFRGNQLVLDRQHPRFASRWLVLQVLLLLLGCYHWAAAQGTPQSGPTADQLKDQASRCRRLLDRSVIDFYLPACVDTQNGGYLENLDAEGNFVATDVKFLTLQARQLWFFSTLASAGIRTEQALAAASSGFDFLQHSFLDSEYGGYFSQVTDAGQTLDDRKHVYLNAFALYALSKYYVATRNPSALEAAQNLYEALENHAYDSRHGGYQEFFTRQWQAVRDGGGGGYVGAINTKTYNSHLHIMEALAEYYRAAPQDRVAQRIGQLIQINTTTVRHPSTLCNLDGWTVEWQLIDTSRNLRASYGHDVECAWLVLDAGRTIGWPAPALRNWAESICRYSLQHGYDQQHGGFYYTGPVDEPADDTRKEWWVQAEALVSMLTLYQLTGNAEYYQRFAETLDFVERHQVAEPGGWWSTVSAEGQPRGAAPRSSMWQGAYHNGRSLLYSADLLDQLAAEVVRPEQPPQEP